LNFARDNEQRNGGGDRAAAVASFDWLAPLPVFTGIGVVFGYAPLGASGIVLKSEGALRDWAGRQRRSARGIAVVLVLGAPGCSSLPIIAIYSIAVFWMFRGKMCEGYR
jgi:cytochrome bd-type quinol oxidase subunit 2